LINNTQVRALNKLYYYCVILLSVLLFWIQFLTVEILLWILKIHASIIKCRIHIEIMNGALYLTF